MTTDQLCHRYLAALNAGDLKAVLDLFTPDAQVSSPLYGLRDAQTFYAELFEDTSRSDTRLLNIFDQSSSGSAIALHFEYDWTLASGKLVKFECVDVFEITDDGERFKKITIIYDTAHLRSDFDASKKVWQLYTLLHKGRFPRYVRPAMSTQVLDVRRVRHR